MVNATTERNTESHLLVGTLEMVPVGVNNIMNINALNT